MYLDIARSLSEKAPSISIIDSIMIKVVASYILGFFVST